MANSIKSIIPKAALCYQWHSKGVLMHCLRAQPPPLPQKSKLLWSFEGGAGNGGWGVVQTQSYQRPERACFSCTQEHQKTAIVEVRSQLYAGPPPPKKNHNKKTKHNKQTNKKRMLYIRVFIQHKTSQLRLKV